MQLHLYFDLEVNVSEVPTNYFNMAEYLKFYCNQDVNIFSQGFYKFREDCSSELHLDVDDYLSAPSLENKNFEENLYYHIHDFYKYSGVPRTFIHSTSCVWR